MFVSLFECPLIPTFHFSSMSLYTYTRGCHRLTLDLHVLLSVLMCLCPMYPINYLRRFLRCSNKGPFSQSDTINSTSKPILKSFPVLTFPDLLPSPVEADPSSGSLPPLSLSRCPSQSPSIVYFISPSFLSLSRTLYLTGSALHSLSSSFSHPLSVFPLSYVQGPFPLLLLLRLLLLLFPPYVFLSPSLCLSPLSQSQASASLPLILLLFPPSLYSSPSLFHPASVSLFRRRRHGPVPRTVVASPEVTRATNAPPPIDVPDGIRFPFGPSPERD